MKKSAPKDRNKLAAPPHDQREIILLGVVGMSPAVITETVWALAFPRDGGEPLIPHRVRLITTTEGLRHVEKLNAPAPQFNGVSPWAALRAALASHLPLAAERLILEPARVLTAPDLRRGTAEPLADIRTLAENEAVADFILEEVRACTGADQRLIATLAGGRKTMGALLYAAMNLIARETDLLTHVLVNAPFEGLLTPPFYFPSNPPTQHELRDRDGKPWRVVSSEEAVIELAPVPFVPLRNRFHDLPERARVGGFMRLMRELSRALSEDGGGALPRVTFPAEGKTIHVDDLPITLENRGQVAFLRWLCGVRGMPWLTGTLATVVEFFRAAHGFPPALPAIDAAWRTDIQRLYDAHGTKPISPEAERLDERQATRAVSLVRVATKIAGSRWKLPNRRGWELPGCEIIDAAPPGAARRRR